MGCPGHCVRFSSLVSLITVLTFLTAYSNYLTSVVGTRSQYALKRPIFTCDVAVQTDSSMGLQDSSRYDDNKMDTEEGEETTLRASHLNAILKWSKEISSDINLSSGVSYLADTNIAS